MRDALRRAHRGPHARGAGADPRAGRLARAPVLGRRARPRHRPQPAAGRARRCSRRWPRARPQRGWLFAWGLDYDAAPTPRRSARRSTAPPRSCGSPTCTPRSPRPRALELAQVTGPVEFPTAREVVCVDGVPTGELRETGAQELVLRAAPGAALAGDARPPRRASCERLNALGLTGAHVMDGEPATHDLLRDLEGTDELTLRLRVPLWLDAGAPATRRWRRSCALRDARGRAVARRRRRSSSPTA